jgi:hypothetical protein
VRPSLPPRQRRARRGWLPKHVSTFRDRHGKAHYRYRRTGFATYYFKNEPGTDAFLAELRACNDGVSAPEIEAGANRAAVGTFDDLLSRYYRSPDFLDPGERARVVYRGTLERWRSRSPKGRRYGEIMVRELQPRHVEAMLAELLPHRTSANMLRKRLSALMKFAMRIGMAGTNPVIVTRPFKVSGGGFILSINDTPGARATFERFHVAATETTYTIGAGAAQTAGELMVLNFAI